MNKPELHKFEDDLKNIPGPKSNAPPRTIRAKDLDENNAKLTLVENPDELGDSKSYRVRYGKDGTYLTDISGLPEDAIAKEFDVCKNGQPRTYWFVVWENEPELPE